MPNMSNSKYQTIHNAIHVRAETVAWKAMEIAGKEDFRLAKDEKGNVDENGTWLIVCLH